MNGNKIFCDTNILLYYLKGDPDVIEILAEKEVSISFITELELLSFPKISSESERTITGLLKNCTIIDVNSDIKELTIKFRKESKLKLPDAIIAATAFQAKLPLLTSDNQFRTVKNLEIIIFEF